MKHFVEFLKYQPPGRLITTGFAVVILLGAFFASSAMFGERRGGSKCD